MLEDLFHFLGLWCSFISRLRPSLALNRFRSASFPCFLRFGLTTRLRPSLALGCLRQARLCAAAPAGHAGIREGLRLRQARRTRRASREIARVGGEVGSLFVGGWELRMYKRILQTGRFTHKREGFVLKGGTPPPIHQPGVSASIRGTQYRATKCSFPFCASVIQLLRASARAP